MLKMNYNNENNMEIVTEKPGKIRTNDKKDNSKRQCTNNIKR
jgi:hypothetical protein